MGVRANRRVLPATMENMYSNPLDHHDHGHREELQQVQRVKAITRDSSLSALEEATTPALVHTPPQLNRRSSKAKIAEPKGHVYGMVTVNGEVQAAFDPWKGAALQRERSAAPCSSLAPTRLLVSRAGERVATVGSEWTERRIRHRHAREPQRENHNEGMFRSLRRRTTWCFRFHHHLTGHRCPCSDGRGNVTDHPTCSAPPCHQSGTSLSTLSGRRRSSPSI